MDTSTRLTLLAKLHPIEDWKGTRRIAQLEFSTTEPFYAIPPRIIEMLASKKGWLSSDKAKIEMRFGQACDTFNAVGILFDGFAQWRFARAYQKLQFDFDICKAAWPDHGTSAAVALAEKTSHTCCAPIFQRQQAYVAWLLTSQLFLRERDSIRRKWGKSVDQLGRLPVSLTRPQSGSIEIVAKMNRSKLFNMITDFTAFYQRWHLLGLATWDLPIPLGANLGAPSTVNTFLGLQDAPAIQLSKPLRLQARFPYDQVLRHRSEAHLEKWQSLTRQQDPAGIKYARLARCCQLHFLRNIVLKGAYPDLFVRCESRLDEILARYFRIGDETIRKLRLWISQQLRTHEPKAENR